VFDRRRAHAFPRLSDSVGDARTGDRVDATNDARIPIREQQPEEPLVAPSGLVLVDQTGRLTETGRFCFPRIPGARLVGGSARAGDSAGRHGAPPTEVGG
jgi:hypothetical protein